VRALAVGDGINSAAEALSTLGAIGVEGGAGTAADISGEASVDIAPRVLTR
jgi:hypothetical protein